MEKKRIEEKNEKKSRKKKGHNSRKKESTKDSMLARDGWAGSVMQKPLAIKMEGRRDRPAQERSFCSFFFM